jgi:hypothetical protein
MRGQFAEARQYLEETLALIGRCRALGNEPSALIVLAPETRLAQLDREEGKTLEAQLRIEAALKLATAIGHTGYICFASTILGELHIDQARMDSARLVWEQGLAFARATHHRQDYMIPMLLGLGQLAMTQGDRNAASVLLNEGLLLADEMSRWHLAHALEAILEVAAADGQQESALQLAGAAAALRDSLGTPTWPTERARLDPVVAGARQSLTAAGAAAAWSRGEMMPIVKAVALASDTISRLQMSAEDPLAPEIVRNERDSGSAFTGLPRE